MKDWEIESLYYKLSFFLRVVHDEIRWAPNDQKNPRPSFQRFIDHYKLNTRTSIKMWHR